MAINNTPNIGPYTELKPFRFWCQKVLPLVYDESLSYYELLCKVVDYLNKTMEDVDQMITDINTFKSAYDELLDFVNAYFENLDIQEEINNKLDQMAESGYFHEVFYEIFHDDVLTAVQETAADWLDENITQETGYVIDKSLTIENAAADAKVTGDAIFRVTNAVYSEKDMTSAFSANYFINLSGGVGSTAPINAPSFNQGYSCLIVPCKAGDQMLITTRGGASSRAWAILDSDMKILSVAAEYAVVTDFKLNAAVDGYFVINSNNTYTRSAIYITPRIDNIENIIRSLLFTENLVDKFVNNYYVNLSGGIGTTAPISSPTYNLGYTYLVVPCKAGDQMLITSQGGAASRAWAILDSDMKILSVAAEYTSISNLVLTAMEDGYFVINFNKASALTLKADYTHLLTDYLDQELNREQLLLPKKICGVVGVESNIYYENALRYGTMDTTARIDTIGLTETSCERFAKRLIWKPTSNGTTLSHVQMYKHNIETPVESKEVNFIAAPRGNIANTISCLVIGDSKTAFGQIVGMLKTLFGDSLLNLLGTRYGNNDSGDTSLRHEGRAGWSAGNYINNASVTVGDLTLTNPFYNDNYTNPTYGGHFDFSKYCTDQGYTNIDYVIINLGTNDFGVDGKTYADRISAMVDSIHSYDESIKIIVSLIEGVYMPKLEWASRNAAFFEFRKALMDRFENTPYVYLNPQYLSMDLYEDYTLTLVPLSYADELYGTGKTRPYTSDGIHQNNVGFYKNAVSMYTLIKCIEAGLL